MENQHPRNQKRGEAKRSREPHSDDFANKEETERTQKKTGKTHRITNYGFRWITLTVDFFIFVAAGVYSFFAYQQWQVTAEAAKAAKDGVVFARENERLDHRAWITISGIVGFPEAGKEFRIKVVVTNSGKTLAKNLTAVCGADVVDRGRLPDFNNRLRKIAENQKHKDSRALGLIPPNGRSQTSLEAQAPGFSFTEDQIKDLKAGNPRLILYGVITYDDIFKERHWLAFCNFLAYSTTESDNGGWGYMLLGKYNDSGDGDIPSDFWK